MGNVRSISEFREAQDDDFLDVGVGSEAVLLHADGQVKLHWASYGKVMDYIAIAFYAKKLIVDSELLATNNKLLSEDEKDEQVCASIQSLKNALESIVFRSVQGEELTEDETAEMQAEYEEKASRLIEEDE